MRSLLSLQLSIVCLAAQPILNEADTGLETYLRASSNWTESTQPRSRDNRAIQDFDFEVAKSLGLTNTTSID
jgi:hypothetical protein